jgi:hypothetical protein
MPKHKRRNLNCKLYTGLSVQYTQFWTHKLLFQNVFHVPNLKLKQMLELFKLSVYFWLRKVCYNIEKNKHKSKTI